MHRALVVCGILCGCNGSSKPMIVAPYTLTPFDQVRIHSQSNEPDFQQASATVDFHDGPFASAKLVIDLGTTCYPFEDWTTPPPGQNWPADCDAFDRNFEFSLDGTVELVRAITPFGGPMHIEVDLTDVANGLPGVHTLGVTLPTWSDAAGKVSGSDGGWSVSAHVDLVPGVPPRKVLAVIPLFYLSQDKKTPPPVASFDVPLGTTSARIEYRATGHGGASDPSGSCIGPAEEFCMRTHHVLLDGAELQKGLLPWRRDCNQNCTVAHYAPPKGAAFDYCMENPCGDMNSVKAPRANWCPGTVTPPFTWDGPTSGSHQLTYSIDGVVDGGSWRLSATYFAFGD